MLNSRKFGVWGLAAILLVSAGLLVVFPVRDYDTFWHLANGRAMVESGRIVSREIFSYTAYGVPFQNHEWLAQIIMYLFYAKGGANGLILYKLLLTGGLLAVVFGSCRRFGANPLLSALFCFWMMVAGLSRFTTRPQLFSYLALALVFYLLFGFRDGRLPGRRLFWLLPIMLLWDCLHGALYGLVLAAAFGAAESLKYLLRRRPWLQGQPVLSRGRLRALWLWGGVVLIGMLINPYGLRSYDIFVNVLKDDFVINMTGEFTPTTWAGFEGFWLLLGLVVLLLVLRWRRVDLTLLLVLLPFCYLGVRYNRAVAVFAIVAVPFAAGEVTRWLARLPALRWTPVAKTAGAVLLTVGCLGVVKGLKFPPPDQGFDSGVRFGLGLNQNYLPVGSGRFIKAVNLQGNLYNNDRFGGYFAYVLSPERKIFHYNHPSIFRDLYRYVHDPSSRAKWNHQYAIVAKPDEIDMFQREGWVTVYWEPDAMILARPGGPNQSVIDRYRIRYFKPLLTDREYLTMAASPAIAPILIRETVNYLRFRRDDHIAELLVKVLDLPSAALTSEQQLAYLQQVAPLNSHAAMVQAAFGLAYYRQGQLPQAEQHLSRALQGDGNLEFARLNLGYLYLDLHRYDEADGEFQALLQRNAGNPNAVYGTALLSLRQGRSEEARQRLEKYLELAPAGQMAARARQLLGEVNRRSRKSPPPRP